MATRVAGRNLSVLGAFGVATSLYAIHVKRQKLALQDGYSALCDLESFSCSQVLTSEYGSLLSHVGLVQKHSTLDLSNAHLGVLAYALFALYPIVRLVPYHAHLYVFASVWATAVMLYLAYVLAFVLHDLCLVCVAIYIITGALLWNSLALHRAEQLRQCPASTKKVA